MSGHHLHRWLVGRVVLPRRRLQRRRRFAREANCSHKRPRGLLARGSSGEVMPLLGTTLPASPVFPVCGSRDGAGAITSLHGLQEKRMSQHPMLAVRGEAVLEVDPEIARIEVSVAAVDSDRAKTLQTLNERAVAVAKVLASFPEDIEKNETSGVRVSPPLAGPAARGRVSGYHGAVHHAITVSGFGRLGELMAQLADLDQAEVGGPWWELRPGSPVYGQVRVAAVNGAVASGPGVPGARRGGPAWPGGHSPRRPACDV